MHLVKFDGMAFGKVLGISTGEIGKIILNTEFHSVD